MNILLLSTIYPLPTKENKGTSVCHYFTKEWVADGHNVRVIHYQAVYPFFYYWIAKVARNYITAKTGAVVYKNKDRGDLYTRDGVQVLRIPLFKSKPHGKFSSHTISRSIKQIIEWNKDDFIPDVIVGHFPNPQIEIVARLKDVYSNAITAIVMHGDTATPQKIYGDKLIEYYKKIDKWGFRSKTVKENFENKYGKVRDAFMCYSGVPAEYITTKNSHIYHGPMKRFIYVGEMIKRKYPAQILDSLVDSYPQKDFIIDYVGNGHEIHSIQERADMYDVVSCVNICGRIPREDIKAKYDAADCMIMISKNEAYGLVYLEAMSRGCITIASKHEGFDGIIEDGVNGFLCEAGNVDELSKTIKRINSLSPEELNKISANAIKTAIWLTDKNAADMYLNDLVGKE